MSPPTTVTTTAIHELSPFPSRKNSPKIDDESPMSVLHQYKSQESIDDPFFIEQFFEKSGITEPTRQGLAKDIVQTQLALWTCTFSIVSTYCWQKRVQPRSFVVALVSLNLAVCLSGLLALLVAVAHLFNKDLYSLYHNNSNTSNDGIDSPAKRRRATSISSYCSVHSRQGSESNTPTVVYKGQARFWQSKIITERKMYYGNTIRS